MAEITDAFLKQLCRERNYYWSRPDLNDVLHLTNKGLLRIQNLECFSGLKCLYLEGNAFSEIEGLEELKELRSLYLAKNALCAISSGLLHLTKLVSLDLSYNHIRKVENLAALPSLESLLLTGNMLTTKEDVEELSACPCLATLDIADNRIEDPAVVEMVEAMPLRYLRMSGNPIVSKIAHYRKRLLSRMDSLKFLDDSPAFEKDVRKAKAFMAGGFEAERAEREAIKEEEAQMRRRHREAFDRFLEEARRKYAENPPPPHDPMRFRAVPPGESDGEDDSDLPLSCRLPRNRRRAQQAQQQRLEAAEASAATVSAVAEGSELTVAGDVDESARDVGGRASGGRGQGETAATRPTTGVPELTRPNTGVGGPSGTGGGISLEEYMAEIHEMEDEEESLGEQGEGEAGGGEGAGGMRAGVLDGEGRARLEAALAMQLATRGVGDERESGERGGGGGEDGIEGEERQEEEGEREVEGEREAWGAVLNEEELERLRQMKLEAFEREMQHRKELREQVLARAAARAEAVSARFHYGTAQRRSDGPESVAAGRGGYRRPVVFGTTKYRELWEMARHVPEREGGEEGEGEGEEVSDGEGTDAVSRNGEEGGVGRDGPERAREAERDGGIAPEDSVRSVPVTHQSSAMFGEEDMLDCLD